MENLFFGKKKCEFRGPSALVFMNSQNIFKDTYGPKGANLTLDCEARGFPAPSISWQFETVEGETIFLPSDDQAISIQMRGGPEANMVTGWAQILALEPGYSGVYHCIAENTQVTKMRSCANKQKWID